MRNFWRIGQTGTPLRQPASAKELPPDMAPAHEQAVCYAGNMGALHGLGEAGVFKAPFPASGLKGALAHRAEFHLNKLRMKKTCRWAEDLSDGEFASLVDKRGMDELFGTLKDSDNKTGRAGAVLIDDCYLTFSADNDKLKERLGRIAHNSLDRFTQGVRLGLLFSEQTLYGSGEGEIVIGLSVLTRIWDPRKGDKGGWRLLDKDMREAFRLALKDLCAGRLAIGAGDGQGHGRCEGEVKWEDGGAWLREYGSGAGNVAASMQATEDAA
jgi:hypothetical protein